MKEERNGSEEKRWRVNSVGKALSILNAFDPDHSELSLAQLCGRSKLPKSTAFNLVKTLLEEGFLRKAEVSQNYLLGLKLFELGYRTRNSLPIISYAIPIMEEITRFTGEITYLTTVYSSKLLILEGVYPDRRFVAYSTAGKTLPMHCTSAGKAILSGLPEEMVRAIMEREGMYQSTPNTINNIDDLLVELERIRRRGYSEDHEEETLGVHCASLVIRDPKGLPVGTISISGSTRSLSNDKIQTALPLLERAARYLAQRYSLFPAVYYPMPE